MFINSFLRFLTILLSSLFITTAVCAETSIVHGPFKTDLYPHGEIYFEQEDKEYSPVNFILAVTESEDENAKFLIDHYAHDGSSPNIETVFFYSVHGVKNIFVIVSWSSIHRGEGVHGKFYEIYSYYKNTEGYLVLNEEIKSDMNLRGFDGYMKSGSIDFDYKTANEVKKYIRQHYPSPKLEQ